ncbi:MAG TPA: helix-turn-helix transcriptional regulator [Myxococcales bacterium]|jgi:transcriptional regulator with XRE-family HTH domain|nr:helix-turn-helix transcriptional regulator [Myxococcales bacterium]
MDSYTARLSALGGRARALRIMRQAQQREIAARAGVSLGTVMRFERTGRASMENVLRIALALGADEAFGSLFAPPKYQTIDEALARPLERKRIRKRK